MDRVLVSEFVLLIISIRVSSVVLLISLSLSSFGCEEVEYDYL
jgi:hypothetical protein